METTVGAGAVLGIWVDNPPSVLIRTEFTPPKVGGGGGGTDIGAIRASSGNDGQEVRVLQFKNAKNLSCNLALNNPCHSITALDRRD